MHVIGIDFTSAPSSRKPITALHCSFDGKILSADTLEEWTDFEMFEAGLKRNGPWIAGIDFPFGQSREFVENIGWPLSWVDYVAHVGSLERSEFRDVLLNYKKLRAIGNKEHRRATDKLASSISPQKLYGVPVALMFFEGAPRLLGSGVTIPHMQEGDPLRIVIEAYPGILARSLINRRSYKSDTKRKQTYEKLEARRELFHRLKIEAATRYGFAVDAPTGICDDPGADHLDALLCAVQAAWAWSKRESGYGKPDNFDALEGHIADPHLL
tara:strand:+ start:674 stop:1483 length:810 start_codon:yes stop_codon:yes gene_type:complete